MVLRRRRIEQSEGQERLFEFYGHRYAMTNLPASWSAEAVIDGTYQRCDQENVTEQMGSGVALWRMPVAEFGGATAPGSRSDGWRGTSASGSRGWSSLPRSCAGSGKG